MSHKPAWLQHLVDLISDCIYSAKELPDDCLPAGLHIRMRQGGEKPLLILHFKENNSCRRETAYLKSVHFYGDEYVVSWGDGWRTTSTEFAIGTDHEYLPGLSRAASFFKKSYAAYIDSANEDNRHMDHAVHLHPRSIISAHSMVAAKRHLRRANDDEIISRRQDAR